MTPETIKKDSSALASGLVEQMKSGQFDEALLEKINQAEDRSEIIASASEIVKTADQKSAEVIQKNLAELEARLQSKIEQEKEQSKLDGLRSRIILIQEFGENIMVEKQQIETAQPRKPESTVATISSQEVSEKPKGIIGKGLDYAEKFGDLLTPAIIDRSAAILEKNKWSADQAPASAKIVKFLGSKEGKRAIGIAATLGLTFVAAWMLGAFRKGKEQAEQTKGGKLKKWFYGFLAGGLALAGIHFWWKLKNQNSDEKSPVQAALETAEVAANVAWEGGKFAVEGITGAGKAVWNNVPDRLKEIVLKKGPHTLNVLKGNESYTGDMTADFFMALAADGLGEFVLVGGGGYLVNSYLDLVWNLPMNMVGGLKKMFIDWEVGPGLKQIGVAYVTGAAVYFTSLGAIDKARTLIWGGEINLKGRSANWMYEMYKKTPIRGYVDRHLGMYLPGDAGKFREIRGKGAIFSSESMKHRLLHKEWKAGGRAASEAIAKDVLADWNQWDNMIATLQNEEVHGILKHNPHLGKKWETERLLKRTGQRKAKSAEALQEVLTKLKGTNKLPAWVPEDLAKQLGTKDFSVSFFKEKMWQMVSDANVNAEVKIAEETVGVLPTNPVANAAPETGSTMRKAAGAEGLTEPQLLSNPTETTVSAEKPALNVVRKDGTVVEAGAARPTTRVAEQAASRNTVEAVTTVLEKDGVSDAKNVAKIIAQNSDSVEGALKAARGVSALTKVGVGISALCLAYEGYQLVQIWSQVSHLKDIKDTDPLFKKAYEEKKFVAVVDSGVFIVDAAATTVGTIAVFNAGSLGSIGILATSTGGVALIVIPIAATLSAGMYRSLADLAIQEKITLTDRVLGKDEIATGQSQFDQLYNAGRVPMTAKVGALLTRNTSVEAFEAANSDTRREIITGMVLRRFAHLNPQKFQRLVELMGPDAIEGLGQARKFPILDKVILPEIGRTLGGLALKRAKGSLTQSEADQIADFNLKKGWFGSHVNVETLNDAVHDMALVLDEWTSQNMSEMPDTYNIESFKRLASERLLVQAERKIELAFGSHAKEVSLLSAIEQNNLRQQIGEALADIVYYQNSQLKGVITQRESDNSMFQDGTQQLNPDQYKFAVDHESAVQKLRQRFDALNAFLQAKHKIDKLEIRASASQERDVSSSESFLEVGEYRISEMNVSGEHGYDVYGEWIFPTPAEIQKASETNRKWVHERRRHFRKLMDRFEEPETQQSEAA